MLLLSPPFYAICFSAKMHSFLLFLPCICERVLLHRLESFFSEAISFYSLMERGGGEGFFKKGRRSVEFCGSEGKPLFEMDAVGEREMCVITIF